jgi:hypothetical protein
MKHRLLCRAAPHHTPPHHTTHHVTSQGRITLLELSQVGLVCRSGLPANLSGLAAVNTLDLAFNDLNTTFEALSEVRTPVARRGAA